MATIEELSARIELAIPKVINYVLDQAEAVFQDAILTHDIGEWEGSTGEFASSFVIDEATYDGSVATGSFFFNPEMMDTYDPDNLIHGSNYPDRNDVREALAEILFEGKQGSLISTYYTGYGDGLKRDTWGDMVKELDRNFDNWVKEGLRKEGLSVAFATNFTRGR